MPQSDPQKALERILAVMGAEQFGIFVDSITRAHERSVTRRCVQSAEILFSEKGFVQRIRCTDDVFVSKYQPE